MKPKELIARYFFAIHGLTVSRITHLKASRKYVVHFKRHENPKPVYEATGFKAIQTWFEHTSGAAK